MRSAFIRSSVRGKDTTSGEAWLYDAKEDMVRTVPCRHPGMAVVDPPLTLSGRESARQNASCLLRAFPALAKGNCVIFSSPSLGCLMTASEIADAAGDNTRVRVEGHLFDFCGFYRERWKQYNFTFLKYHQIASYGIRVDPAWQGYAKGLEAGESRGQFLDRSAAVLDRILRTVSTQHIIIVAHAGSHLALGAPLISLPPATRAQKSASLQWADASMKMQTDDNQHRGLTAFECDEGTFQEAQRQHYETQEPLSNCFTAVYRSKGGLGVGDGWDRVWTGVPTRQLRQVPRQSPPNAGGTPRLGIKRPSLSTPRAQTAPPPRGSPPPGTPQQDTKLHQIAPSERQSPEPAAGSPPLSASRRRRRDSLVDARPHKRQRDSNHCSPTAPPMSAVADEAPAARSQPPMGLMDARDDVGRWLLAQVAPCGIDGAVSVHFIGWNATYDEVVNWRTQPDRFAPASRFSRISLIQFDPRERLGFAIQTCEDSTLYSTVRDIERGSQAADEGVSNGWILYHHFPLPGTPGTPGQASETDAGTLAEYVRIMRHENAPLPLLFRKSVAQAWTMRTGDAVLVVQRKPAVSLGERRWIPAHVMRVEREEALVQYQDPATQKLHQYWYHIDQSELVPQGTYSPPKRMRGMNGAAGSVAELAHAPAGESARWKRAKMERSPKPSLERLRGWVRFLEDGKGAPLNGTPIGVPNIDAFSKLHPPLHRIGSHADGTCFFHSAFHSMDTIDPRYPVVAPRGGASSMGMVAGGYRASSSSARSELGIRWRSFMASAVTRNWFERNDLQGFYPGGWTAYMDAYADTTASVGGCHNMHLAAHFHINVFFVTLFVNPDTKNFDFSVRVCSPDSKSRYIQSAPSIALYHIACGDNGHYESLQQVEEGARFGKGVFTDSDPFVQLLLREVRSAA